jgi:hypothetical protein
VLVRDALRVAEHDDLVVTEAGGVALGLKSPEPACALLLAPPPSAGSWPFAIWIASPPAIAADATSDAATSRSVTDLVEGLLRRRVLAISVMPRASPREVKPGLGAR